MRTNIGKIVAAVFVAGILLVTETALIRQGRVISRLQREHRSLRGEIQAKEQAANNDAATTRTALDEELGRLRAEAREVHKLRNEVSQLRAQRSELEKLRAENQRLKTAPIASVSSAVQDAQQPEYFDKENWIFAGYATPEATLQSFLWAMREGDWKNLQASVTAEGLARIGKGPGNEEFAARIEEENKRKVGGTAGFRILERKAISEDEVALRIHADGSGSSTGDQNIVLKRLDGEWKVERSYRDAPVPPSQSP
jgi:hypothetical protein